MDLKISHKSKLPLHIQVEELLRKLIALKEYQNGAFLPKEVELANRLGVSRNTIRQATNKLEYEGLLTRKKGVGTKVAPQEKLSTGLNNWYSFTKEMQSRGIDVSNLLLKLETVKANEKMATFFNIKPGTPVIKLSKLKGVGDKPIVYFESYFHPRIVIDKKDDLNKPLYTLLEEKFGIVAERSSENISARAAGKIAKRLQVESQAPILFRERFVYDLGDRPIEYNLGYYHSERFTYSIDIKK
ncbi:GntR family transcriptional regulator [Danxiaibacter flavus]|uniref:GntR family transcriptional regulator n=1 Tax=Danxiaibacter flavus TaxID=3049108 RepID=A0ABV3ZGU2_9BACT|nr:GntR family transcriptional regulator [Chitinophagaceae bacterium DXS]